ncbi:MAG: hypothetical protein EPO24_04760 [Bacteroidetes bacterium]|nr:MAG: hypothetical protein EPO24_04760 [Bacteroidota bacterium]
MSHKKNIPVKRSASKNPLVVIVIIILGATSIFYAMYLYQQSLLPQTSEESQAPGEINLPLESTVSSIAKQFICTCGKCGELSLDVCTCPEAAKERETIRRSLQAGQTPQQVIAFVNDTYGGMKPEIQNQ